MSCRCRCRLAAIAIILFLVPATHAIEIGDEIGPYTVTQILPGPPGGVGDLEYAEGMLWSLEDYNGIIHKLDPSTGEVLADYWVPGEGLHDEWPYDGPRGLAWDGSNFFMATYAPNYLRKLTLGEPPDVTVDWIATLPDWPMDLAYGEGYLYAPEYLGPIRRLDPVDGSLAGTIPSPSDYIYAITFDGTNLIAAYGVGGGDRVFWLIDPQDGTVQDTWIVAGWTTGITGMAFDQPTETLYVGYGGGIIVAALYPLLVDQDGPIVGTKLTVSPNPIGANDLLSIRLARPDAGQIDLFDVSGRHVGGCRVQARSTSHQVPIEELIDRSFIPAGIYLLRWRSDQTRDSELRRITVLR